MVHSRAMSSSAELVARLTPKQQRWVRAYIDNGGNNADACRVIGLRNTSTAYLKNDAVMAAVRAIWQEAAETVAPKIADTKLWLLDRLRAQADADLADLFNDQGHVKPVREWPDVWRRGLVVNVEAVGEILKLKLADRSKLLELIGRHVDVGAWSEKLKIESEENLADVFARRRQAAQRGDDDEPESEHGTVEPELH